MRTMHSAFLAAVLLTLSSLTSVAAAQEEPPAESPPTEAAPAEETAPAEAAAPEEEAVPAPAESTPAAAEGEPVPVAEQGERPQQLGQHVFPVPAFSPWSFPTTHFAFRQGVTHVRVPDFPLRLTRDRDLAMTGLTEEVEFGARFIDPLEVFVVAGGRMLVGNGVDSILTLGADYSYFAGLGALFRFLRLEGTQLSLRARVVYDSGGSLELLRLIDALEDPQLVDLFAQNARQVVLEDTSRREFVAHVLLAQSLGRHFGLQAALGIGRSTLDVSAYEPAEDRDIEVSHTDFEPEGDLTLDASLEPWVPLGVMLEYSARTRRFGDVSGSDSESTLTHLFGFGIHTLHRHFQIALTSGQLIGVEPVTRTIGGEARRSGDPTISYVQLSIYAFW